MNGGHSLITTGIFTKVPPGFVRVVKYNSERHTSPCKMWQRKKTCYKDDDQDSSLEAKNSKYKCAYRDNFCCHKFTSTIPAARALTNFFVQLILNEFISDIILFCIVGIALS